VGLVLVILAALPDLFDGALAKASNTSSQRGAFFDSVIDRITDSLLFGGVAWYFASEESAHLALLPFAVMATSSVISYERAKAESAASAQAQALLARTELAALRNKLNPHFLFNTLHSIIALTRKDSVAAEKALLMFSDMLRYVLDTEKAGEDHVPLGEELDFARDYLNLEALRLGHRLTLVWQIDESLLHHAVPALSIQPLVENSIKHAFNPRSAPGRLEIIARRDAATQSLIVTVRDDGPGCSPEALASAQGLGLKTVARRLQLEHGERASLRTESAPGAGFAVHLHWPLTS
jgi:LytS/YehU family sensor histidine kinase